MTNKPMLSVELRELLGKAASLLEIHSDRPSLETCVADDLRALLHKSSTCAESQVEPDAWKRDMDYRPEELGSPETEPVAQYQGHAIPQWLRNHFSWIEDEAMKLGGCGVFTQMRTKVQAYFEMVRGEPMSDQAKTTGPMVLVPREATPRMIEAAIGIYEKDGSYAEMFGAMFGAMCGAAPVEIDPTPRRLAHAETVIEQQNNLIASLRAELVQSYRVDSEHQGEPVAKHKPVAKLHAERLTGKDGEYGVTVEDSEWFNTCRLTGGTFSLYAEQPAPVAVVMPERCNERDHAGDFTYEATGWNSCLDAVSRLNGVKP